MTGVWTYFGTIKKKACEDQYYRKKGMTRKTNFVTHCLLYGGSNITTVSSIMD
jgi:hypothetical protein